MSVKKYAKRYIYFMVGLLIIALGIALSTKSNLGVSTISSIPYVLSIALPMTMGQFTIIVQLVYLLCQILILKKNFRLFDLLQLVSVVVFGYFVDFWMMILDGMHTDYYVVQWLICIIGIFVVAFGLNIEVRASVTMVASDGLLDTIAKVYKIEFSKVKIVFDIIQVSIAAVFSLVLMHYIAGIREGTLASAILVGMAVKLYNRVLGSAYEKVGLTPLPRYGNKS